MPENQVYWTLKGPRKSFLKENTKPEKEKKSLFRQRQLFHAKALGKKNSAAQRDSKEVITDPEEGVD